MRKPEELLKSVCKHIFSVEKCEYCRAADQVESLRRSVAQNSVLRDSWNKQEPTKFQLPIAPDENMGDA